MANDNIYAGLANETRKQRNEALFDAFDAPDSSDSTATAQEPAQQPAQQPEPTQQPVTQPPPPAPESQPAASTFADALTAEQPDTQQNAALADGTIDALQQEVHDTASYSNMSFVDAHNAAYIQAKYAENLPQAVQNTKDEIAMYDGILNQMSGAPDTTGVGMPSEDYTMYVQRKRQEATNKLASLTGPLAGQRMPISALPSGDIVQYLPEFQVADMINGGRLSDADDRILEDSAYEAKASGQDAMYSRYVNYLAEARVLARYKGTLDATDKSFYTDGIQQQIFKYRDSPNFARAFEAEKAHITDYLDSPEYKGIGVFERFKINTFDALLNNSELHKTSPQYRAAVMGATWWGAGRIVSTPLYAIPAKGSQATAGFIRGITNAPASLGVTMYENIATPAYETLHDMYPQYDGWINAGKLVVDIPVAFATSYASELTYNKLYSFGKYFTHDPSSPLNAAKSWYGQMQYKQLFNDPSQLPRFQAALDAQLGRTFQSQDEVAIAALGSVGSGKDIAQAAPFVGVARDVNVNAILPNNPIVPITEGSNTLANIARARVQLNAEDPSVAYTSSVANRIANELLGLAPASVNGPARETINSISSHVADALTGVQNARQVDNVPMQALRQLYINDVLAIAKGDTKIASTPYVDLAIARARTKGIDLSKQPRLLADLADSLIDQDSAALTTGMRSVDFADGKLLVNADSSTAVDLSRASKDLKQALALQSWSGAVELTGSLASMQAKLSAMKPKERLLAVQAANKGMPKQLQADYAEHGADIEAVMRGTVPTRDATKAERILAADRPANKQINADMMQYRAAQEAIYRDLRGSSYTLSNGDIVYPKLEQAVSQAMPDFMQVMEGIAAKSKTLNNSTQLSEVELSQMIDPDGYFVEHPELLRELANASVGGMTADAKTAIADIVLHSYYSKLIDRTADDLAHYYLAAEGYSAGTGASIKLIDRNAARLSYEITRYRAGDKTSLLYSDPILMAEVQAYTASASGRDMLEDKAFMDNLAIHMTEQQAKAQWQQMDAVGLGKFGQSSRLVMNPSGPLPALELPTKLTKFAAFLQQYGAKQNTQVLSPAARPIHTPTIPYSISMASNNARRALARPKAAADYEYDPIITGVPFTDILDNGIAVRKVDPELVFFSKYADLPLSTRASIDIPDTWKAAGSRATDAMSEQTNSKLNMPSSDTERYIADRNALSAAQDAITRSPATVPDHVRNAVDTLARGRQTVSGQDLAFVRDNMPDNAKGALEAVLAVMPSAKQPTLDSAITAVQNRLNRLTATGAQAEEFKALQRLESELLHQEDSLVANREVLQDDGLEALDQAYANDFNDPFDADPELAQNADTLQYDDSQILDARHAAGLTSSRSEHFEDHLSESSMKAYLQYIKPAEPNAADIRRYFREHFSIGSRSVKITKNDGTVIDQKMSPEMLSNFKALSDNLDTAIENTGDYVANAESVAKAREVLKSWADRSASNNAVAAPVRDERNYGKAVKRWLDSTIDRMPIGQLVTSSLGAVKPSAEDIQTTRSMLKDRASVLWQAVAKEYPEASVRDRSELVMGRLYNMVNNSASALSNWKNVSRALGIDAEQSKQLEQSLTANDTQTALAKEHIKQAFDAAPPHVQDQVRAEVAALTTGSLGREFGTGGSYKRDVNLGTSARQSAVNTDYFSSQDISGALTWYTNFNSKPGSEYDKFVAGVIESGDATKLQHLNQEDAEHIPIIWAMQKELATKVSKFVGRDVAYADLKTDPAASRLLATVNAVSREASQFAGTQYANGTALTAIALKDAMNGTHNLQRTAQALQSDTVHAQMYSRFSSQWNLPSTQELMIPEMHSSMEELTARSIKGYQEALESAGAPADIIAATKDIHLAYDKESGGYKIQVPDKVLQALDNVPGAFIKATGDQDVLDATESINQHVHDRAIDMVGEFIKKAGIDNAAIDQGFTDRYGKLRINAFMMRPKKYSDFLEFARGAQNQGVAVNTVAIDKEMRNLGFIGLRQKDASVTDREAQGLLDLYAGLKSDLMTITSATKQNAWNTSAATPLNNDGWNTINASMIDLVMVRRNVAMMQGIRETLSTGRIQPDTLSLIRAMEIDVSSLGGFMNSASRAATNINPGFLRLTKVNADMTDAFDYNMRSVMGADLKDVIKQTNKEAYNMQQADIALIDVISDPRNSSNFNANFNKYVELMKTGHKDVVEELSKRAIMSKYLKPVTTETMPKPVTRTRGN